MPEVVLAESYIEKVRLLRDIFASYFQKEVQILGDFRKNEVIRNLIHLLTQRVGQKLDINRLSQELGVVRQTIYNYLDFLNGTYFITLLPAFGHADVAARKQRKVYFIDTGLFSIPGPSAPGQIFENAVFNQLRSQGNIFYYEKDGQEIDFVLKTSSKKLFAFEVKQTVTKSDLKRLKRQAKKLAIKNAFAISLKLSPEKEAKYLFQLPSVR
jgi:hypothetical protein